MKRTNFVRSAALVSVLTLGGTVFAGPPSVAGNEAVAVDSSGRPRFELPPAAMTKKGKPIPESTFHVSESKDAKGRPTFAPWVFMIETKDGLKECMRPWFEAKGCRDSTSGKALAQRFWVVKQGAQWLRCPKAAIENCVPQMSLDDLKAELQ